MKKMQFALMVGGLLCAAMVAGGLVFSALSGVRPRFDREVAELLATEAELGTVETAGRLSAEDLTSLPDQVRHFLEVGGYVDAPRGVFFRASYKARMNLRGGWFPIDCEQYNSVAQSTRIWYGRIRLLPFLWAEGRHLYRNGRAHMLVKFGPITLVDIDSKELGNADMITFFNDLAFFMPNALVHPGITWRSLDDNNVLATFSNAGFQNSAVLSFDRDGLLVNFVTETRGKLVGSSLVPARWATPITGWRLRDGRRQAVEGLALYYEPDGTAPYIRFEDPDMAVVVNKLPAP